MTATDPGPVAGLPLGRFLGVPLALPGAAVGVLGAVALVAALARGPGVALAGAGGLAGMLLARDLARITVTVGLGRAPRRVAVSQLLGWPGTRSHTPSEEAVTALAGPAALLFVTVLTAAAAAGTSPAGPAGEVLRLLVGAGLLLTVVHLLPGLPADGGRLVRAAAWLLTGSRVAGTRVARRVGRGTAVLVGLVALSALTAGTLAITVPALAFGGPLAVLLWRGPARRRRPADDAGRPRVADVALAVGLTVLAAVVVRAYVVRTFSVDSESMQETLRPGDRVLADRVTYRLREVRRGDLIVLHRPSGVRTVEEELVKRVIALPGERVAVRDGTVSVDGVPLVEPYAGRDCPLARAPLAEILVPAGHLYVLGDDRCRSLDSRELGPVDDRLVEGHIFGIVWPLGRMGRFSLLHLQTEPNLLAD